MSNKSESIKFIVYLDFVENGEQDGYQKTSMHHCDCKYEAISRAVMKHQNEYYPLRGISVYECVFCS